MGDMPKHRFSWSKLESMSKCGEQYRRRYVEGERTPPSRAMLMGRAVDEAVNLNIQRRIDTGSLAPLEEVRDRARDSYEDDLKRGGIILLDDEVADCKGSPKLAIAKGQGDSINLASLHHRRIAPSISQPTAVQHKFEFDVPGYDTRFVGVIDVLEDIKGQGMVLRDTKTTKKSPPLDTAEQSMQLRLYALGMKVERGKVPFTLILDFLVNLKAIKTLTLSTSVEDSPETWAPILRRLETALVALEKGVFLPAPTGSWWCSVRFCPFYHDCKYIGRSSP